jgi:CRP-like cAMP-binding protein
MQHGVDATTQMTLAAFSRDELWRFLGANLPQAYDLIWRAATAEHFLGEAVLTFGQRDAEERVAWALLWLHRRMRAAGIARDGEMPFPYRQQDLADVLGLSLAHTNKTLARLRLRRIAVWRSGGIGILDFEALEAIAATGATGGPSRVSH